MKNTLPFEIEGPALSGGQGGGLRQSRATVCCASLTARGERWLSVTSRYPNRIVSRAWGNNRGIFRGERLFLKTKGMKRLSGP